MGMSGRQRDGRVSRAGGGNSGLIVRSRGMAREEKFRDVVRMSVGNFDMSSSEDANS